MTHEMRLHDAPFKKVQDRSKDIEMRLYDEKRKLIKIGDLIDFENRITVEHLVAEVIALHKYNTFEELYSNFNKVRLGYNEDDIAKPEDMSMYYPEEEINKYGVVGIEIRVK